MDYVFSWLTTSPDPQLWPTVISELDMAEWHLYPDGMVACLVDLITGHTGYEPVDYLAQQAANFTAFAEGACPL